METRYRDRIVPTVSVGTQPGTLRVPCRGGENDAYPREIPKNLKNIPEPYRLFFYSFDCGEPKHIHVQRDKLTCKFWFFGNSHGSVGTSHHRWLKIVTPAEPAPDLIQGKPGSSGQGWRIAQVDTTIPGHWIPAIPAEMTPERSTMRNPKEPKFWLQPLCLEKNCGFTSKALRAIQKLIKNNMRKIVGAWHEHCG